MVHNCIHIQKDVIKLRSLSSLTRKTQRKKTVKLLEELVEKNLTLAWPKEPRLNKNRQAPWPVEPHGLSEKFKVSRTVLWRPCQQTIMAQRATADYGPGGHVLRRHEEIPVLLNCQI